LKILMSLDRSARDVAAVSYTAKLAKRLKASVAVVHVVPPIRGALPGTLSNAQGYAEGVAQSLREQGLTAEAFCGKGDPANMILEVAEEIQAELITMVTHGRRGMEKLVLGSVADRVVSMSQSPVLLVRLPTPEEQQMAESPELDTSVA
jgi:nucleotide-binding universal stress UspA family protein